MPLSKWMALNGLLRFLLWGCGLAALAYWGVETGSSWLTSALLAVAAPAVAMVIWLKLAAPNSTASLSDQGRSLVELGLFGLAVIALAIAGESILAIVFIIAVLANFVLDRFIASRYYETDPMRGLYPRNRQ